MDLMKEKLLEWNFPQLVETFEEQGFDDESFPLLTEDSAKEIIPKLGIRLRFMKFHRAEFGMASAVTFEGDIFNLSEFDSVSTTSSRSLLSNATVTCVPETPSPIAASPSSLSPLSSQSISCESVSFTNMRSPSQSADTASTGSEHLLMFDVRQILDKDPHGLKLVKRIDKCKFLSKADKKTLVHILCAHLVTQYGNRPSYFVKEEMAREIIQAFPFLKDPQGITGYESFYCRGATRVPACGALEDRLCYLRRLNNMATTPFMTQPKKRPRHGDSSPMQSAAKQVCLSTAIDEPTVMIQWMKSNTCKDDSSKVKEFMEKTAMYRHQWIKEKGKQRSMADILDKFPRLLEPGMIEQDFKILYPDAEEKLYEKWNDMSEKLLTYIQKVVPTWKTHMQDEDFVLEDLTSEQRQNCAIYTLPTLFTGRRKFKGGRVSYSEAAAAFVDFQCENTGLDQYLKDINRDTRSQPYMLILGGSALAPQQVFVIFERHAFQQSSLVKALDVCFKTHFVFDLSYQEKCSGVWEFIESVVFELKGSVKSNTIREFRAYCSSHDSSD
ncbi:uncharacterized protein [Asterias amurensis]|uniref:uncharacterized protein n=1 Tax=Asterias amurensis TaxID=7602 RepID=UPI003AB5AC66